ncbi:MAG TPA: hypothetical protein VMV17_21855, partial [Streptosporangiaceae bacterium]|nr:hypothetical protein [Streptosporangiaceae bacterium]
MALDSAVRTAYVTAGRPRTASGTLAMVNVATCNAVTSRGCRKDRALISVPNPAPGGSGPAALAINPRTSTIYVTHA